MAVHIDLMLGRVMHTMGCVLSGVSGSELGSVSEMTGRANGIDNCLTFNVKL